MRCGAWAKSFGWSSGWQWPLEYRRHFWNGTGRDGFPSVRTTLCCWAAMSVTRADDWDSCLARATLSRWNGQGVDIIKTSDVLGGSVTGSYSLMWFKTSYSLQTPEMGQ